MSEKRVLILSASAGAGHVRAAQALEDAARRRGGVVTRHIDVLEALGKVYKKLYGDSYLSTVNQTPEFWGYMYLQTDRTRFRHKTPRLIELFDRLHARNFVSSIVQGKPDAILCTHFVGPSLLLTRRGRHAFPAPVTVAVTDFDVHSFWIHDGVAKYFVASEEIRWLLQRKGVPAERIQVTGIPILPAFAEKRPKPEARAALGLDPARTTVLVLGGGFGVGHVERVVGETLQVPGDFQVMVVAGRNEGLRKRLSEVRPPAGKALRVFGFVDNMHELMDAADVAISKSGGLTVSECLTKGLPMIVFAPIPGQEECNASYLLEHGAGLLAKDLHALPFKLARILSEPGLLARMARGAAQLGHPQAAHDVLEATLATIGA